MATAKIIEITSESQKGYEDAVLQGIREASKTVDNIRSAWVKDHEVLIGAGDARSHRVNMKVTFLVGQEDASH
jgi:flavin-binding protein dodecin